jgi:BioD-like phosphotransacetylase family protein
MSLDFSPLPGAHERRLQRLRDNPLFPADRRRILQRDLELARQRDREERDAFLVEFQTLLQEAMNLSANVESDVILTLKERLDQAYERCSSLPGDMTEIKQALHRLVAVIMNSVRAHAADDPQALAKLRDEDIAREVHYELQDFPLVADLLREDAVIEEDELVPTLLSESRESLAAALQLFDADQIDLIAREAHALLLQRQEEGQALPEAWERLREIESTLVAAPSLRQTLN